jgi:GH24 family phage-related lysozyme (muramidase)
MTAVVVDASRLKAQLILHESLKLKVYKDSKGIDSIGIGRNLVDVGISLAEADLLYDNDVARAVHRAGLRAPVVANAPRDPPACPAGHVLQPWDR